MNKSMSRLVHFVFVQSTFWLLFVQAQQVCAQSDNDPVSPVTTLEEFRNARDLGDKAKSYEEKIRYWRHALTWQSDNVAWLRLAHKFADSLREEWPNTGRKGQPPSLDHPYYRESESVYREILDRFDHMDFYKKNGSGSWGDESLLVPKAASWFGLADYPVFLSMMQDFHDQRVKDWLAEPVSAKPPVSTNYFGRRHKRTTHDQLIAAWLDRRARASSGDVFSEVETRFIDTAVKNYAYQCCEESNDYNSVPGLAELATRYTAPVILDAIRRRVEIESPPFPRVTVRTDSVIEVTVHGLRVFDNQIVDASKVDLDTGTVVTTGSRGAARVVQSSWMKRGGLDFEVTHHRDYLMNLITFGMKLIEVPQSVWDEEPVSWEELKAVQIKKGALEWGSRGGDQKQFEISADAQLPLTLAFKTREEGVGLLQVAAMRELDPNAREYDIRYRMFKSGELGP